MVLTRENMLHEKAELEQVKAQVGQQMQDALIKLARIEGGLRAFNRVLEILDMPEEKESGDV